MDKKFGIKHVVAMGIGTALFVVLTNVQIPVGFINKTLSFAIGGNPLPLGGGRSLVNL